MSVNSDGYIQLGGNIRNIYILLLLALSFGTVTDIDGNIYETVQIGEQLWMAENLKVTHYNNGDEIPNITSMGDWFGLEIGAYCYFDNNIVNTEIYGNLYSWFTIDDDRGVCPNGFHPPSNEDYILLTDYLGGSSVAGGKLKSTGTIESGDGLWNEPNAGATNESGFSGLPGGTRYHGDFGDLGGNGWYWSSSGLEYTAYYHRLTDDDEGIHSGSGSYKYWGMSIRCIGNGVEGCTNPYSPNYDEEAVWDDGSCQGWVLEIPLDYPSIQAGIDAAQDRDTVLVSSGTYYENINFNGKNITVIGENKELTIIDGEQNGSVVTFENNEDSTATLSELTIINGRSIEGGGIYCRNANPNLINLIIRDNYANEDGGGVYLNNSSPLIGNVTISSNSVDLYGGAGGGIFIYYSPAILINVMITNNYATNYGGGVYLTGYSPSFENVEINNNTSDGNGGGVYLKSYASLNNVSINNNTAYSGGGLYLRGGGGYTIQNVVISGNIATGSGGGIACRGSDPIIKDVIITNNYALSSGGGFHSHDYSDPSFENVIINNNNATNYGGGVFLYRSNNSSFNNVIINGNTTNYYGGGLYLKESTVDLVNVSITDNITIEEIGGWNNTPGGGGIFLESSISNLTNVTLANNIAVNGKAIMCYRNSNPTLINSIIKNDEENSIIFFEDPTVGSSEPNSITISYSDVNGGEEAIVLNNNGTVNWDIGNIDADPLFTDPVNGDFTLQPTSPCIDAGDPDCEDPDGSTCDMGAYYFPQESNTLNIGAGANLMSFSVLPRNGLDDLPNDISGIIGAGVAANNLPPWSGSLQELSCDDGYWLINSGSAFEWDYFGIPCSDSLIYNLNEGANLISYSKDESGSLSDVLPDAVEDCLSGIIGQGVASNNMPPWAGSLTTLEPNKGYWFISNCEIDFQYDEPTTLARMDSPKTSQYAYNQSSQQAFYFIESIENIEIGDWILSFNGDEVIGAREWTGSIIDVPAMGDDGSKFTQGYCIDGSIPTFKVEKANGSLITLTGDIPEWSNNQLYMIGYLEESIAVPAVYSLSTAYPNPFNPTTTLSFAIPIDSEVYLSVYNLQGREVVSLVNGNMDAGYHSVIWNANSMASGVYFVKMIAGEYMNTQKLMLIK